VFLTVDQVWHAVIPFEENFHPWLRQRRNRSPGGGALWVPREDEQTVHVYATADLSSDERTNLGIWLEPLDALNSLIDRSLALPGVRGRRWLGAWEPPATATAPPGEPTTFTLGNGPKKLYDHALREAEQELGCRLGDDVRHQTLSPDDIKSVWLPLVTAALDQEWDAFKRERAGRS
jgi:hypothetical protein